MNNIEERKRALASHLQLKEEEMENIGYDPDDNQFKIGEAEYLVLTDKEADAKAEEDIKNSLWAFDPRFILSHCQNTDDMDCYEYDAAIDALKDAQAKSCERLNGLMKCLIADMNTFVDDAIREDGRGHFISFYDGNEEEVKVNDTWYYIYRTN